METYAIVLIFLGSVAGVLLLFYCLHHNSSREKNHVVPRRPLNSGAENGGMVFLGLGGAFAATVAAADVINGASCDGAVGGGDSGGHDCGGGDGGGGGGSGGCGG
ncbi:hypothetical protein ABFS82_13G055200 [Erythranthe guttata]|uniref:loricrin-like n=1 Tax=Erythranthe guttata TaxID=4155 RepID=UPI00064DE07F|nr:PREDICTED: loricrin-like [Erythranthe guttata]|eukprot:XP_012847046.1 PREDICTED: loricrin-like [Erythranthe guttata]